MPGSLITASPDSFVDFDEMIRYLRERAEPFQRPGFAGWLSLQLYASACEEG